MKADERTDSLSGRVVQRGWYRRSCQPAQMNWKQYCFALLAFNGALFVLSFGLLYAQQKLPLNPDGKGSLGALGYKDTAGVEHKDADTGVVFNTVCSFVTNTNLQHYSGEQHLTYFSQLGCIVWLMFVTPAVGLGAMLAVLRGLRGDKHQGDFYLDVMRGLLFVFIPVAVIIALFLVAHGTPMTFKGMASAKTLDGAATKMETQSIARGPVAALVAIKQAGTNGGFFGPNSAHPFENASAWTNLLSVAAIVVLPMASIVIVMAGLMLKEKKHAAAIYGVMLSMMVMGATVAIWAESKPAAATEKLAAVVQDANLSFMPAVVLGPVADHLTKTTP